MHLLRHFRTPVNVRRHRRVMRLLRTGRAMTGMTAGIPSGHAVGVKRAAQLRACPQCKALVLTAWDHDTAACLIHLDPTPLTTEGEINALLERRATYDAEIRNHSEIVFEHRHSWRIRAPRRHTVLAIHACPNSDPPDLSWLPADAAASYPDEPPF